MDRDEELARGYLSRACELRWQSACLDLAGTTALESPPPKPLDLRLLLREGGGNLMQASEPELYARACEHGWAFACGPRGVGP